MAELLTEKSITGAQERQNPLCAGADVSSPRAFQHVTFLVLICVLVWGATCWQWDLHGADEGRYVQIAKELLQQDNWFHLTLHGEPYDQKPPLAFWQLAVMLKISGGHLVSWMLRLPAVLLATLTVLLTYGLGRRVGGERCGFISGLMLVSMPLFLDNAPQAELNVPFAFWITCALALWYGADGARQRLSWPRTLGFWLAMACAFFTKGPLAFLIVLCPLAWEAFALCSWRPLVSVRPLPGMALLALLIAGWFYAEMRAYGSDFVWRQVSGETLNRFAKGDHREPFWYYFPHLFVELAPWGWLLIPAGVALWRERGKSSMVALRPFAVWAGLPFLFLCLASGKRLSYLLPLLPATAVLVGWLVSRTLDERRERPKVARLVWALFALIGAALLVGSILTVIIPQLALERGLEPRLLLPGMWTCAGVGFLCASFRLWRKTDGLLAFYSLAAAILLLGFLGFLTFEPALDPQHSTRGFSARIQALGEPQVGAAGEAQEPEYHVYGTYQVVPIRKMPKAQNVSRLPKVLVLDAPVAQKARPVLEDAGYRQVDMMHPAKEPFVVFASGAALQRAEQKLK